MSRGISQRRRLLSGGAVLVRCGLWVDELLSFTWNRMGRCLLEVLPDGLPGRWVCVGSSRRRGSIGSCVGWWMCGGPGGCAVFAIGLASAGRVRGRSGVSPRGETGHSAAAGLPGLSGRAAARLRRVRLRGWMWRIMFHVKHVCHGGRYVDSPPPAESRRPVAAAVSSTSVIGGRSHDPMSGGTRAWSSIEWA